MVHQYSFDDDDVTRFSERLSDKFEIKARFDQQGTAASQDVDFVGDAEVSGTASDSNMERLNLFGVALSAQEASELGEKDTAQDKQHRRKFVADLLDVLHQVDNDHELQGLGGAQDLDQPKRLLHFDPYG